MSSYSYQPIPETDPPPARQRVCSVFNASALLLLLGALAAGILTAALRAAPHGARLLTPITVFQVLLASRLIALVKKCACYRPR